MKAIIIMLPYFVFPLMSHAVSLQDLQQKALKNREIIVKYKANFQASGYVVKIAKSAYLPSLDMSYSKGIIHSSAYYERGEITDTITGIININLFSGFKDKYNIKSTQLLQRTELYKLQGLRQDILLNVALRYLSIYYNRSVSKVTLDSYNTIAKAYEYAANRFKVGQSSKNELLQFKVDLDNALIDLKKAQVEEKKSLNLLQREIMAKIQMADLSFVEFDSILPVISQEKYSLEMLKNRSEIKIYQEQIKAADAQVQMAYADFYPKVDLSSSYRNNNDDATNYKSIESSEEFRTSLIFSMNIFDGFNTDSKINIAKLEAQSLRSDLADLQENLKSELNNLFLDYAVNVENVAVSQNNIIQAQENLRVYRASYQEGVTTESDLLDAITKLSRTRFNYVSAKRATYDNYYNILRYVEKSL